MLLRLSLLSVIALSIVPSGVSVALLLNCFLPLSCHRSSSRSFFRGQNLRRISLIIFTVRLQRSLACLLQPIERLSQLFDSELVPRL
jgi:hypothetical protein